MTFDHQLNKGQTQTPSFDIYVCQPMESAKQAMHLILWYGGTIIVYAKDEPFRRFLSMDFDRHPWCPIFLRVRQKILKNSFHRTSAPETD